MTLEDLMLTKKYSTEYSDYCRSVECGETCPVFVEHQSNPKTSCFMIYCRLRETGKLGKPPN